MNYEINNDTLAILYVSEKRSKVVEKKSEYYVENNSVDIVKNSCEYFGSSYKGRNVGTKNLIGVTHKSPLIIEESNNIIFFPTASPRTDKCMWISLNNILSYKEGNSNKETSIEFINGKKIIVNCSIASFNNQILRSSRLEYVLKNRKYEQKFKF